MSLDLLEQTRNNYKKDMSFNLSYERPPTPPKNPSALKIEIDIDIKVDGKQIAVKNKWKKDILMELLGELLDDSLATPEAGAIM